MTPAAASPTPLGSSEKPVSARAPAPDPTCSPSIPHEVFPGGVWQDHGFDPIPILKTNCTWWAERHHDPTPHVGAKRDQTFGGAFTRFMPHFWATLMALLLGGGLAVWILRLGSEYDRPKTQKKTTSLREALGAGKGM